MICVPTSANILRPEQLPTLHRCQVCLLIQKRKWWRVVTAVRAPTIFSFYLPVSRFLEDTVTCSKTERIDESHREQSLRRELRKGSIFDHFASTTWSRSRHIGLANAKGYHRARVKRYPNSDSSFQLIRLATSGDISVNPGPAQEKRKCQTCLRTIARNRRAVTCGSCGSNFHIKCGNVSPKQFCSCCTTWNDIVNPLPFVCISDESFASLYREQKQHRKVRLVWCNESQWWLST